MEYTYGSHTGAFFYFFPQQRPELSCYVSPPEKIYYDPDNPEYGYEWRDGYRWKPENPAPINDLSQIGCSTTNGQYCSRKGVKISKLFSSICTES